MSPEWPALMFQLLKKPSAWIPIALSLTILAALLTYIGISGPPVRGPDEGVGAHLFQMWLVFEVFMVAFFGVRWLPRAPKQALLVLALQAGAVFAACTPVAFFHL